MRRGSMTNPNDPAFSTPSVPANVNDETVLFRGWVGQKGLTKREYFAAMAMQGILAHCEHDRSFIDVAMCAISMADALIAELNK